MYTIKIVGSDVRIVTPDGGEYRFQGYGDYTMLFGQDALRSVCNAMRSAGIVAIPHTFEDNHNA